MNEDQRFNSLLNRYLNDVATQEEHNELMQLIRRGDYDEQLKDRIDATLLNEKETPYEDIKMERAQEILKSILSTDKVETKVVTMRPWKWVAAAAMLTVTISVGWWLTKEDLTSENKVVTQVEEKLQPAVFSGKQFVHLPDGSTVILNDGSELSYSASFGDQVREVTLVGEGYFDIQHDPTRPFRVVTGKVTTTVLGTAFNVRAYANQSEIEVTVTRGKVQVDNKEKTLGVIIPDQQIAVNTLTDEYVQSSTKAEEVVQWKSKYLILDDVNMETAAAIIEEKYNTKIIFSTDELKECRITATFLNGEDIKQVLTVVSEVVNATYKMQPDGNVKLDGEGCKRE